jgi:hypothetical protein
MVSALRFIGVACGSPPWSTRRGTPSGANAGYLTGQERPEALRRSGRTPAASSLHSSPALTHGGPPIRASGPRLLLPRLPGRRRRCAVQRGPGGRPEAAFRAPPLARTTGDLGAVDSHTCRTEVWAHRRTASPTGGRSPKSAIRPRPKRPGENGYRQDRHTWSKRRPPGVRPRGLVSQLGARF